MKIEIRLISFESVENFYLIGSEIAKSLCAKIVHGLFCLNYIYKKVSSGDKVWI